MAELVGGALLSAFLKVLFNRLASPEVINFFGKNESVAEQLDKLKIILLSANALLNDAEEKQIKDGNINEWVDALNQVLSDTDNAIDKVNTKALCRKVEGTVFLKRLIPTSLGRFERAMKEELEKIIVRLEKLLAQKDPLGLENGVSSKSLSRSRAPIEDPSHVYGRDGDKEAIVKLVVTGNIGGQDKISVIPIVGMGGVGKTTLARLVYNDSRVKDWFEHRAWVTVSDDFDVLKLAKLVLEGLSDKKCEVTEPEKLGEELKKFLSGKKFFLVLDDVWNKNYNRWNSLKSFFQVGADGSKIILTTRSEEIGSKMGSVSSHSLGQMEDEDCWKLFQKHAFRSVEECTEELETIGKEIVQKCKGLPLAVISVAGLLRSVSDPKEWEKVLKNDVWDIERRHDNDILPSLWLSYSDLPSNAKRCFAYCSIFPKDYKYNKEKMMFLWMAEGLVQGEDMEDVGEEYFKTLVSRSLLQRSATDDGEEYFLMHDLVHDLATFVSGNGFCMRLGEGGGFDSLTSKTQHLLCHSYLKDPKGLPGSNRLRTFISNYRMSDRVLHEIPKKFRCLRVLCLSTCSIEKVLDSIGKLKHLRYLDLSHSSIGRLPDTICKLYNLQALLLRRCIYLTHLPTTMDKLINLRHLDISDTWHLKEIPPCIAKMKALRTITKFVVGSGIRISVLKKFPHSRGCLHISHLENIVDANDVLEAEFKEKSLVTELILEWFPLSYEDAAKDRAILDAFQPHPNMKKLSIYRYGGNEFSNWVVDHSFSNVTEVSLLGGNHCFHLPSFGQLPALKKLQVDGLNGVETIGSEFYGPSEATPFPSLKILKIEYMKKLQSWSFEAQGAFPCLEELTLWDCPMLNTICLDCFPSLRTLAIFCCPKLEFLGLPLPSSLKELSIEDCDMMYSQRMQWGLKALTKLIISRNDNADSFPEEGLLPTTLTNLEIDGLRNLKSFNGKAFQQLTSLKKLEISNCPKVLSLPEEGLPSSLELLKISNCPKLLSLPEEGLPSSLERLDVWRCPILEARLKREIGEDWHKSFPHSNNRYLNL